MMPLTAQEDSVKKLLMDRKLSFEHHHVFDLKHLGRLSVDFLVFFGSGIVLECTACSTKRGRALSEVRRRSAFIDYRFGLLKRTFPNLVCGALIEAPSEDQARLRRELEQILRNADFTARTGEELNEKLKLVLGGLI